jgi:hypothetical protein
VVPANQVHDFNLDIIPFPSGLFWTRNVDEASVSVDPSNLAAGAMMQIQEMHLSDYHTLANSFVDGALSGEEPANVSYTLRWSGAGTPDAKNDPLFKFRYTGILNSVNIEWSAKKSDGFRFQSDPASTSGTNYALLANEHNGTFY